MTSTPIVSAAEVNAPGMDTVGVDSPGSDSHIITTTRRYGKARIMLRHHTDDDQPGLADRRWPPRTPRTSR